MQSVPFGTRSRDGGGSSSTWLFDFFDAQLAQTRDLLLELLAHLGEIFRDLGSCFEDCGVDDFLEEPRTLVQSYLKKSELWSCDRRWLV